MAACLVLQGALWANPVVVDSVSLDDGKNLTLEQCLAYVLDHANSISSANEKIRSHAHRLSAAKKEYLPKFLADVNFGMDQHFDPVVFSSAGVEVPIFWSPLNVERKIAQSDLNSSKLELETARQKLAAETKEAYFHSLYARKLIRALQDSIRQLEGHRKVIELLYGAGRALKVDILKVQAQLNREQIRLEKAYADQRYYDSLLNNLLDLDLNHTLNLTDESFIPLALTLDECYQIAEAENPMEGIFSEKANRAKLEVDRVKRSTLKNLKMFGKVQRQIASYVNQNEQDHLIFGLNGNLGLWDWYQNRQFVKEKQSSYESDLKEIQDERNRLKIQVKRSYEELDIAETEVQAAWRLMNTLDEEYLAQKVRFEQGMIKTEDLLSTQTMLSKARADYEKAVLERQVAKRELYQSMGVFETAQHEGRGLTLNDQEFLNPLAKKSFN